MVELKNIYIKERMLRINLPSVVNHLESLFTHLYCLFQFEFYMRKLLDQLEQSIRDRGQLDAPRLYC